MRGFICATVVLVMLTTACGSSNNPNIAATTSILLTQTLATNEEPTTGTSTTLATSTTTTTAVPSSTTATVQATVDLEAIDWANHSYPVGCPSESSVEVALVDGQAAIGSFFYSLGNVVFGSLGAPAEPVAVVELICIGAGSWPSSVLIYGGSGISEQFLGVAASAKSHPDTHPWSVQGPPVIENGILVMTGVGWTTNAPHCCPDLNVVSKVALDENKTPYEVEHTETPR